MKVRAAFTKLFPLKHKEIAVTAKGGMKSWNTILDALYNEIRFTRKNQRQ
jgi:hypothetical protein